MRPLIATVFTLFMLLVSSPIRAQLQEPSPPVNVIIDSDMAIDVDDVGDHAVMWGLANRGEVNVLALIASSSRRQDSSRMRGTYRTLAPEMMAEGA